MVPPRLTLVPRNNGSNDNAPDAEAEVEGDVQRTISEDVQRTISEIEAAAAGFVQVSFERRERLRALEAVLFSVAEPQDEAQLAERIGGAAELKELLAELQETYASRGVNLVRVAGKWAFRTAGDLSYLLEKHAVEEKRLSKAALETLAIIAYHQPVTRAEIEDIRGVTTSAGTLDILMEAGWIRPRGRRRAPGKPLTYGTTESFLSHFGLDSVKDLPGLADLRAAGLLDGTLPPGFTVPDPTSVAALMPDELPLEAGDDEEEENAGEGEPDDPEAVVDADLEGSLPDDAGGAKPSDGSE